MENNKYSYLHSLHELDHTIGTLLKRIDWFNINIFYIKKNKWK